MDAHAEESMRDDCFGCGVKLPPPEAGPGGPGDAGGRRREIKGACWPLDINPMAVDDISIC